MALTQATDVQEKPGEVVTYPLSANAKLLKGALVCANGSGYAVAAADSSGYRFLGFAVEDGDNTGQGSGATRVRVKRKGTIVVSLAGVTQADVGKPVYCTADDTVALTSTNTVLGGYIVAVEDTGKARIQIDNAVR